jgi:hypothetical protein
LAACPVRADDGMPQDAKPADPAEAQSEVPPDDAMERAGAVIGSIQIDPKDIFDLDAPGENRRIFRWANAIHPNTRASTIRNLLLFKPGDPYSRRILDETARLLRSQRYLYDADVRPVRFDGRAVDVLVVTHDVWTLKAGLGVGRSGGTNTTHIGLEDSNFLGFGKELDVRRQSSVDRTSYRYRYRDPGIGRSHVELLAEYQNNSDGEVQALGAGVPFYCLDCRFAAETSLSRGTKITSLWDRGAVVDQFVQSGKRLDLYYGWSAGLVRGRARRFRVGYDYDREAFTAVPGRLAPAPVPADRTLGYPWFEIETVSDGFVATHDMDQLHRTEDIALGRSIRGRFGWMAPAFGSDRTGLLTDDAGHLGYRVGPGQLLFLDGTITGRFTTAGAENVVGTGSIRYFKRWGDHSAFSVLLAGVLARALDAENQVLLGGDNGLRGYPLRYLSGDRSVLMTVEQRFYGRREYLHLLRLGAAVFLDAGGAWFHDTSEPLETSILRDVGFGLRIASTRSADGSMLHVDVAFPLDATGTIRRVQLLVSTHETF